METNGIAEGARKMRQTEKDANAGRGRLAQGLAIWLLDRLRRSPQAQPRLALLERISLAPRQSLALVEAEGRLMLVATSAEGAPTFYPLDGATRPVGHEWPARPARRSRPASAAGRISW